MTERTELLDGAAHTRFDVAIIGGGITGASLYHRLCRMGYSVLLLDKGDFACGSSQSSGMMVWGGLLYLRRFDLRSVLLFSRARDDLLRRMPESAAPSSFRYIPPNSDVVRKYAVLSGLYLYWLLGLLDRRPPTLEWVFEESGLLGRERGSPALKYEEGFLKVSDARFVLQWITSHRSPEQVPLNYCAVQSGEFCHTSRRWFLQLRDTLRGRELQASARCVVNCSGVWADAVNRQFGIRTPFRHALSKGVYLGVRRPQPHQAPLAFELGRHGEVLTFVPWGPVSLWGPTETLVHDIRDGFSVTPEDVTFLLEHASRHLRQAISSDAIVSLRCGIRPLAVHSGDRRDRYPLAISRAHHIVADRHRPWISFFGGKLTNCVATARSLAQRVGRKIGLPGLPRFIPRPGPGGMETTRFPGVAEPVPTAAWCHRYELCHTLEDYLRRRTNIAQWTPREGLGRRDQNLRLLNRIALQLSDNDPSAARRMVTAYRSQVSAEFDAVLARAT